MTLLACGARDLYLLIADVAKGGSLPQAAAQAAI